MTVTLLLVYDSYFLSASFQFYPISPAAMKWLFVFVWYIVLVAAAVCNVQVKLSIVQLVSSGGVRAESAVCPLIVAAADSRHR